jgi:hypothetical protein
LRRNYTIQKKFFFIKRAGIVLKHSRNTRDLFSCSVHRGIRGQAFGAVSCSLEVVAWKCGGNDSVVGQRNRLFEVEARVCYPSYYQYGDMVCIKFSIFSSSFLIFSRHSVRNSYFDHNYFTCSSSLKLPLIICQITFPTSRLWASRDTHICTITYFTC